MYTRGVLLEAERQNCGGAIVLYILCSSINRLSPLVQAWLGHHLPCSPVVELRIGVSKLAICPMHFVDVCSEDVADSAAGGQGDQKSESFWITMERSCPSLILTKAVGTVVPVLS